MNTPYGLEVIEDCIACPLLKDRVFCNLPKDALAGLDAISSTATYPKGAILFVEGQEPRGVFILCTGRVKLYGAAANGKSVIFRIADAGEIIGLPSTLSDKPYEVTAEVLEPTQANFIHRNAFLGFLRQHGDAALEIAEMLSHIYYATCQEIRYLGLAGSAVEKFARFLLDLKPPKGVAPEPGPQRLLDSKPSKPLATDTGSERLLDLKPPRALATDHSPERRTLTLTHEEIAETIGTSRETVSRLITGFKRKHLIELHGSTLLLTNKKALEALVGA